MSITRDAVQGFVDGYIKAGGDPAKIAVDVTDWIEKHPVYPQTEQQKSAILSDIESYRGVPKKTPAVEVPPEEIVP